MTLGSPVAIQPSTATSHSAVCSPNTSFSITLILATPFSITLSTTTEKSNSSSFFLLNKQHKHGSPNRGLYHATSLAYAEPTLGFSQAEQPKSWPLPHHFLGPCQADS
ncbi:hypothetical protein ACFX19_023099 [Malus domestica]